MKTLTYKEMLTPEMLAQLQEVLLAGVSFSGFAAGKLLVTIGIDPPEILCYGQLRIVIQNRDFSFTHVALTSGFGEIPIPLGEQGKLDVTIYEYPHLPLAQRIKLEKDESAGYSSFRYAGYERITAIRFYGNHQHRPLQELDPDITLEYLKEQYGLEEYPFVECDSIEFLVLEHEGGRETVVTLERGGFRLRFYEQPLSKRDLCENAYIMVNGYVKDIVLQHEVRFLNEVVS